MDRRILPGTRWRITVVTRRDGRRWPYQLKITDRATGRETREVVRGVGLKQKRRAYERAAAREEQLNGLADEPATQIVPWPEARETALGDVTAKRAPATARAYRRTLRHLEGYARQRLPRGLAWVDQVTGLLAQGFPAWRSGSKVEASTINRDLRHLRGFWGYLVRLGLAAGNPWREVPWLPEFRRRRRVLTLEERQRVLAAGSDLGLKFHAALALAAETGARAQELSHVTWGHVDLSARTWLITRELCGWRPKGRAEGLVFFSSETARLLGDWRSARVATLVSREGVPRDDAPVLLSAMRVFGRGRTAGPDPWEREFNRLLKRACADAGVGPITCHGLRYTLGRLAREAGASPLDIRDLLRHAEISTTDRYCEMDQAAGARAAFDAMRRGAEGAKQVPEDKPAGNGVDGGYHHKPRD